jgi:hypothetical protein
MHRRWTVGRWMLVVAGVGLELGLLRTRLGKVFALMAGGVVGCGLAPLFACRGMRRLDEELRPRLAGLPRNDPRVLRHPTLLAQSYVLIWAGWFLAGTVIAALGLALAHWLQAGRAGVG